MGYSGAGRGDSGVAEVSHAPNVAKPPPIASVLRSTNDYQDTSTVCDALRSRQYANTNPQLTQCQRIGTWQTHLSMHEHMKYLVMNTRMRHHTTNCEVTHTQHERCRAIGRGFSSKIALSRQTMAMRVENTRVVTDSSMLMCVGNPDAHSYLALRKTEGNPIGLAQSGCMG